MDAGVLIRIEIGPPAFDSAPLHEIGSFIEPGNIVNNMVAEDPSDSDSRTHSLSRRPTRTTFRAGSTNARAIPRPARAPPVMRAVSFFNEKFKLCIDLQRRGVLMFIHDEIFRGGRATRVLLGWPAAMVRMRFSNFCRRRWSWKIYHENSTGIKIHVVAQSDDTSGCCR